MGAKFVGLPSLPLRVSCPSPPGQGGPSGWAVAMWTPRSTMRWSVVALLRVYPRDVPHVPAPGSIWVWQAAPRRGFDTGALQGVAPPKEDGDGDCAVDRGSSCTPRSLAMVQRVGGPRVHGVVCAVLYSFLDAPGLQVVRSSYLSGALDASRASLGPLGIHHGGLTRTGISRVRTVAEHPRHRRIVGGVVWEWY